MQFKDARDLYAIGLFLLLKGVLIAPLAPAGIALITYATRHLSKHYKDPNIYKYALYAAAAAAAGAAAFATATYTLGAVTHIAEYARPMHIIAKNPAAALALWPAAAPFIYYTAKTLKTLHRHTNQKTYKTAATTLLAATAAATAATAAATLHAPPLAIPTTVAGILAIYAALFLATLATFTIKPPKI